MRTLKRLWLLVFLLYALPAQAEMLAAGPMLGHTTATETTIWLQTTEQASVRLRYWIPGRETQVYDSQTLQTEPGSFLTARFLLQFLQPGTPYRYEVYINNRLAPRRYPTQFRTQPLMSPEQGPADLKIAIGSCFYLFDGLDLYGIYSGWNYWILDQIRSQNPDLMLWLGDNTYFRDTDLGSPAAMNYRYQHTRAFRELQPLLAAVPHYAIWDDHDYGPDNSDATFALKQAALDLFRGYWNNPSYGTEDTPGTFSRFSWQDVEFFLLDNRFHRAPNAASDPAKPYLGAAQLQWLKESLRSSQATFKIIALGGQVFNPHARESYQHYQGESHELLDWLAEAKIPGVLFISGDRHFTELMKIERPGLYPLYEFSSSPLTSGDLPPFMRPNVEKNPFQIKGTVVHDKNFGLIKVSGPSHHRTLTLETRNSYGAKVWDYQIQGDELNAGPTYVTSQP